MAARHFVKVEAAGSNPVRGAGMKCGMRTSELRCEPLIFNSEIRTPQSEIEHR